MKIAFAILKYMAIIVLMLAICLFIFIKFAPVLGGQADSQTLDRMAKLPYAKNGHFENLEPIINQPIPESQKLTLVDFLINIFNPADGKHPTEPLPTLPLADNIPTQNNHFTWLGHSTVLFRMGDKTLITDPVFYRVSPLPFGGLPYPMSQPPATDELPPIDIVLISHDHYDHLDMRAIKEINDKVAQFIVPLGVKAHLVRWGVSPTKISELGWHEHAHIGNLELIFVPSRHYGGRNIGRRATTLWGGWVVKSSDFSLYFTGDSGYGKHFADIGKTYAPNGFDLMLIENGQYNINWAGVHMQPEQSIQAVLDAHAKLALPIHWAKYDLAFHSWSEPVQRFSALADERGVAYVTPKIGQRFGVHDKFNKWWQDVK